MTSNSRPLSDSFAVTLDSQNPRPAVEKDIRLEDYINDKIQTTADLGNLASLISNVEIQKKQLEEQVCG